MFGDMLDAGSDLLFRLFEGPLEILIPALTEISFYPIEYIVILAMT